MADDEDAKANQVATFTCCSLEYAKLALSKNRGSPDYAINWVMDNPDPGPAPAPPPPPPRSEVVVRALRDDASPTEVLWSRLARTNRDVLKFALYVLNIQSWEEENLLYYVPYDPLEDLLSFFAPVLWKFQGETKLANTEEGCSVLVAKKEGESSGGYRTDMSMEGIEIGTEDYEYGFVEFDITKTWVQDIQWVPSSYSSGKDVWNNTSSEHRFERLSDSGVYVCVICMKHNRQYLYRYEGRGVLKQYADKNHKRTPMPPQIGDKYYHLCVSLYREGATSARFVEPPDDFVPLHHDEANCFDD